MELKIEGLVKRYGNKTVLSGASFTFQEGKIYGIIGCNGAGKTTLFHCINAGLAYESGTITVLEELLEGEGTEKEKLERKLTFEDVGMVSASPSLPEFLTGYEYIRYLLELHHKDADEARVTSLFDLIRITVEDRHRLIKEYSYGMKNKIQLLCCLVQNPKIILLDEPLTSFDIVISHDIKELLLDMKQEHIILMSTHIMQLAQDISDEIVLLNGGKLSTVDCIRIKQPEFEQEIVALLKGGRKDNE